MPSKSHQPKSKQEDSDIQHVRRLARTRLIGALILVLILVSVFSVLLQKNPKAPVSDIPFVTATSQPRAVVPDTLPPEPAFVPQAATGTTNLSIDVPAIDPAPPQAAKKINTGAVQIDTKPKPKPKPETNPRTAGQWVVQLGAFRNPSSVAAALKKAKTSGVHAFTRSVNTTAGKLTRVQVGPFVSKIEAEKAVLQLKSIGFKAPSVKKSQQ